MLMWAIVTEIPTKKFSVDTKSTFWSKGRKIKKMDRFLQGGAEQQPDGFYDSDSDEEQEENPSTGETDSN